MCKRMPKAVFPFLSHAIWTRNAALCGSSARHHASACTFQNEGDRGSTRKVQPLPSLPNVGLDAHFPKSRSPNPLRRAGGRLGAIVEPCPCRGRTSEETAIIRESASERSRTSCDEFFKARASHSLIINMSHRCCALGTVRNRQRKSILLPLRVLNTS